MARDRYDQEVGRSRSRRTARNGDATLSTLTQTRGEGLAAIDTEAYRASVGCAYCRAKVETPGEDFCNACLSFLDWKAERSHGYDLVNDQHAYFVATLADGEAT